jgi:hypothetical protein
MYIEFCEDLLLLIRELLWSRWKSVDLVVFGEQCVGRVVFSLCCIVGSLITDEDVEVDFGVGRHRGRRQSLRGRSAHNRGLNALADLIRVGYVQVLKEYKYKDVQLSS